MFPHTGTVTLLSLKPENNYRTSFIVMGGGARSSNLSTPASHMSFRLDLTYCNASATTYCLPAGDAKCVRQEDAVPDQQSLYKQSNDAPQMLLCCACIHLAHPCHLNLHAGGRLKT